MASLKENAAPQHTCHAFFLNMFLVDASQAIEKKVGEKVKGKWIGKAAKAVAKSVVSDEKIVGGMAEQLVLKVPEKVKEMGIDVIAETKFSRGNYVVLRLQVVEYDPVALITMAKGEEVGQQFEGMLGFFQSMNLTDAQATIAEKMNEKITEAMMEKLVEKLPETLSGEGIIVNCVAKADNEQADYFYRMLEDISDA